MSGAAPAPGASATTSAPAATAGSIDVKLTGPLWDGLYAPALVRNLRIAVGASNARIEREAVLRTPVNIGLLRQSIGSKIVEEPGADGSALPAQITGVVGSPVTYAQPVEFGSRPHFPPPAAIEAWVRRKLAAEVDALAASEESKASAARFVEGLGPVKDRTKRQTARLHRLVARERAVKSITYAICHKIAAKGTAAVHMLRDATFVNREWTLRAVRAAVRAWATEMNAAPEAFGATAEAR